MPVGLSRLRIAGFKSFADPVTVEILPGLTGVIGPNGCGKSNVVEALRWAMGESNARTLRGGEQAPHVEACPTNGRAHARGRSVYAAFLMCASHTERCELARDNCLFGTNGCLARATHSVPFPQTQKQSSQKTHPVTHNT